MPKIHIHVHERVVTRDKKAGSKTATRYAVVMLNDKTEDAEFKEELHPRNEKGEFATSAARLGGKGWLPGNIDIGRKPVPTKKAMKVYHGTSATYLDAIRKNGLTAKGIGAESLNGMAGEVYEGERGESVYISADMEEAREYALDNKARDKGTKGIILEIKIPKGALLYSDEGYYEEENQDEAQNFRYRGIIPPSWITNVHIV